MFVSLWNEGRLDGSHVIFDETATARLILSKALPLFHQQHHVDSTTTSWLIG
jgi:hypothetical protein